MQRTPQRSQDHSVHEIEIPVQQQPQIEENSHYSTLHDEIEFPEANENLQQPSQKPKDEVLSTDTLEQIITFDQLITEIGFGWYQVWMFVMISMFGVTEGSQIIIFSLSIPILQNEWGISSELTSMQASFVFIGFLFGAMLSGQLSDRLGRKIPFLLSSFASTCVILMACLCQNIYQMLVLRFILGIFVGCFAPCSVTMLQEITPTHLRGRFTCVITISVAIGQLYGLFVASLTLDSLTSGNWRLLTLWCTLPGALALFASIIIVDESPRFQLLSGKFNEAIILLNKMITKNKSNVELTQEMIKKLENWTKNVNLVEKNTKNASIACLFADDRCLLTSLIWYSWFSLCFTYYGNLLLLPYTMEHMDNSSMFLARDPIAQLVFSSLSDIAGAAAASYLIEIKGFGRKNSLIIFFFFAALSSGLVYFDSASRFLLWISMQKFFLSMGFIFNYQLSIEVYPTKIRATGLGTAIAFGRFGVITVPWICMYLASINLLSPFLLFTVISLLASIGNYFLPFDTLGKEMAD